jgi:hypothetical protein
MRPILALLAGVLCISAAAQEQPAGDPESPPAAVDGVEDAVVTDAPAAPAEEGGAIYRSVGEDGSIVFSDSPSPGAERIEIRETQTIEAPPPPTFVYERQQAASTPYTRVEIVDPPNDAEIRENTGNVNISVVVEPGLGGSDLIVLLMDGQEVASGQQGTFSLNNVDRGTHQLAAVVKSSEGQTVFSSPPVTFHMFRFHQPPPTPAPKPKPK